MATAQEECFCLDRTPSRATRVLLSLAWSAAWLPPELHVAFASACLSLPAWLAPVHYYSVYGLYAGIACTGWLAAKHSSTPHGYFLGGYSYVKTRPGEDVRAPADLLSAALAAIVEALPALLLHDAGGAVLRRCVLGALAVALFVLNHEHMWRSEHAQTFAERWLLEVKAVMDDDNGVPVAAAERGGGDGAAAAAEACRSGAPTGGVGDDAMSASSAGSSDDARCARGSDASQPPPEDEAGCTPELCPTAAAMAAAAAAAARVLPAGGRGSGSATSAEVAVASTPPPPPLPNVHAELNEDGYLEVAPAEHVPSAAAAGVGDDAELHRGLRLRLTGAGPREE